MQNLIVDFRIFIDTEYFSCAFGLIFDPGWLPLFWFGSWVFHIFDLCFISTEYRFLAYRFDF